MEKVQISQVLECNKVLYKMLEQRTTFPVSIGLKINHIMKLFDEVEEYIFTTMDVVFGDKIDWSNLSEQQMIFYKELISEQIELDYKKISKEMFENNDKLMLSIEDIEKLSIILE